MRMRVRMVVAFVSSSLLLLLLRCGLLHLHLAHSRKLLLLDVLNKFGHSHASLLGILSNLALDLLDLLGRGLLAHEARAGHGHSHRHCAWRWLRRRRGHGDVMSWRGLGLMIDKSGSKLKGAKSVKEKEQA